MTSISPASDQKIPQRYTEKSLDKKGKNKTAFQEEIGWPPETKRLVACLPAGLTKALGGELLTEVIEGLLTLPMEILILGKGSEEYGKLATDLSKENKYRVHIVPNKDEDIRKMYAASDIMLCFSDPSDLTELKHCLHYGVVPIAPEGAKYLEDYNVAQETGNAFLYDKLTPWHLFAAVVRSVETHRLPFDWRTIQKHCMGTAV